MTRRSGSAALFLVALIAVAVAEPALAIQRPATTACTEERLAVELPGVGRQIIAGALCRPAHRRSSVVQVLLAGGTYNRTYWDFAYEPVTYSYRRAAVAAGYATFNVDRLGTGHSDRPASVLLTNESHAEVVRQLVAALRAGRIGTHAFDSVIMVGHSYGSIVAWHAATRSRGVDAVVITGLLHRLPLSNFERASPLYPAAADPAFAGRILDPGYLTSMPGTRGSSFHAADADPALVAHDEATKDTSTVSEVAGVLLGIRGGASAQIDVPVLIAVGAQDLLFCASDGSDCADGDSVLAAERESYPSAPCIEGFVLPRSGHLLNASRNAPSFFAVATAWADRTIGVNGSGAGCRPEPTSSIAQEPVAPFDDTGKAESGAELLPATGASHLRAWPALAVTLALVVLKSGRPRHRSRPEPPWCGRPDREPSRRA